MSSLFEEIANIKNVLLSSDLPKTFTGKIVGMERTTKKQGQGAGNPQLTMHVIVVGGDHDEQETNMVYRIPKAMTGSGQLDKLLGHVERMKLQLQELPDKTFIWERQELSGSVKGIDRHYPIELVQKKL